MKSPEMYLECVSCGKTYDPWDLRYKCDCGGILDVKRDLSKIDGEELRKLWDSRWGLKRGVESSGVWRYRELILSVPDEMIVTRQEGNTRLYPAGAAGKWAGLSDLWFKHEGENPTGSFKDRGMTCGASAARRLGAKSVACASTGNTSASMASYAAVAGMRAVIFIPEGKIAYGKLAQALAYNGRTLQIQGNFDDAMALVQDVCRELNIYLLNSINPYRIEGQKAICIETLQQLDWQVPDWFVIPGGNLGNNSALGKALMELHELGIISKVPRIAVIQAAGANPLYTMWKNWSNGVVEQVTEQEIMDAKAKLDAAGIGAEPASCCSLAGAKKLRDSGVIGPDEKVVGILTGNILKDPDAVVGYHQDTLMDHYGIRGTFANKPVVIPATLDAVRKALGD